MADIFADDLTGGAVAQTNEHAMDIRMLQGRVWVSRHHGMHGSGWRVVLRAKSAIVDPRDDALTTRG